MVPTGSSNALGRSALAMTRAFLPRSVYRFLSYSLLLPSLAWLLWLSRKEPKYRRSLAERFGWVNVRPDVTGCLWIHAASVGEVMAASPLVDALLARGSACNVVVSTNTPTGRDRVARLWKGRVFCFYAPFDTPGAICRLLRRLQPTLLLTMEREVWPERFLKCQEWGIPTVIVNGRLTEKALDQYRRFRSLFTPVWSNIGLVTTPDAQNASRFQALGVIAGRIDITGNLKFDIPAPVAEQALNAQAQPNTLSRKGPSLGEESIKLIVLGSSHSADEHQAIEGYKRYRDTRPDVVLVIAPRHPARFDEVFALLEAADLRVHRTTTTAPPDWNQLDVILVDEMGQLMDWYRKATICIVGGTFGAVGGHNPLEPLQAKKPMVFGPSQGNAQQLFQEIRQEEVGLSLPEGSHLWEAIDGLLRSPHTLSAMTKKAEAFIGQRQGASEKTLEALDRRWPERMRNSAPIIVRVDQPRHSLWLDPDVANDDRLKGPNAFSCEQNPFFIRALAQGGRGQAFFVAIAQTTGLFRHYRRGGILGRVIEDTYIGRAPTASRAMREFALLRWVRLWGLPVPRPLVAHYAQVGGFRYKADLITEEIPGAESLASALMYRRLDLATWQTIGMVLHRLHCHQVYHADLNCHNLLIDPQAQVWVIDFDKSQLLPGDKWKAGNLGRLYRSLRKQASLSEGFSFFDEDWQMLLKAYHTKFE